VAALRMRSPSARAWLLLERDIGPNNRTAIRPTIGPRSYRCLQLETLSAHDHVPDVRLASFARNPEKVLYHLPLQQLLLVRLGDCSGGEARASSVGLDNSRAVYV